VADPIRLQDIRYQINGNAVLDGIDLTVARGEIVAIMGRSGSGKTTLLRLIMGLVSPTAGQVFVDDKDIGALGEQELNDLRRQMGMVFQGAALFDSMTVGENVAFGLAEHRLVPSSDLGGRVRRLLEMVGMLGTEDLMPAQLSGGMRKRVGIARALAMEPSIMLYDEPTAGLDPISAAAVDNLIRGLREQVGVTSVLVSHDLASLQRVADRAALLHGGRFLAVASLAELGESDNPAVRQFLSGSPEGPLTEGTAQ